MFLCVVGLERRNADGLEQALHFPAALVQLFFRQRRAENKEADVDGSLPGCFQLHAAFLDGADLLPDAEVDQHPLFGLDHFLRGKLRFTL